MTQDGEGGTWLGDRGQRHRTQRLRPWHFSKLIVPRRSRTQSIQNRLIEVESRKVQLSVHHNTHNCYPPSTFLERDPIEPQPILKKENEGPYRDGVGAQRALGPCSRRSPESHCVTPCDECCNRFLPRLEA